MAARNGRVKWSPASKRGGCNAGGPWNCARIGLDASINIIPRVQRTGGTGQQCRSCHGWIAWSPASARCHCRCPGAVVAHQGAVRRNLGSNPTVCAEDNSLRRESGRTYSLIPRQCQVLNDDATFTLVRAEATATSHRICVGDFVCVVVPFVVLECGHTRFQIFLNPISFHCPFVRSIMFSSSIGNLPFGAFCNASSMELGSRDYVFLQA